MKILARLIFLVGLFSSCTPAHITANYSTPESTFETWRQSVLQLDYPNLIACYASEAQPGLRNEISTTSAEGLEQMRDETRETEFQIQKIIYQGNKALLRVERKKRSITDIEVLTMIKEGTSWKLFP